MTLVVELTRCRMRAPATIWIEEAIRQMTKIIPICGSMLAMFLFGIDHCEAERLLTNESPLRFRDYQGRASISVQEPRIGPASKLQVCVEFVNEGNDSRFYNPFFRGVIPQSAELAVFDANKHRCRPSALS